MKTNNASMRGVHMIIHWFQTGYPLLFAYQKCNARFQASAEKQLRTAVFWVVMQRVVLIYSNINPTRSNFTQFIYIWKLLYMFRAVPPPIIRSAYNCIYSIWYLSHRYCYSNSSTIAADSSNGVTIPDFVNTVV